MKRSSGVVTPCVGECSLVSFDPFPFSREWVAIWPSPIPTRSASSGTGRTAPIPWWRRASGRSNTTHSHPFPISRNGCRLVPVSPPSMGERVTVIPERVAPFVVHVGAPYDARARRPHELPAPAWSHEPPSERHTRPRTHTSSPRRASSLDRRATRCARGRRRASVLLHSRLPNRVGALVARRS